MKNRDSAGEPKLTEQAKQLFLTFLSLVDLRKLDRGLRNILLHYLQNEEGTELWFDELMPSLRLLFSLCDDMADEYGYEESAG
jgi:hypothetical protein